MSPNQWGPKVWMFLHTLAEKIKEEHFIKLAPSLFQLVRAICTNLPCPDCSTHASLFLSKVNYRQITTKTGFKNMIYFFHNAVNKRKNKQEFNLSELSRYSTCNMTKAFYDFVSVYKTTGNMKLIADNLQRQFVIKDVRNWLTNNHQYLNP